MSSVTEPSTSALGKQWEMRFFSDFRGVTSVVALLFGRVSKPSRWVVETFERKSSLAGQNNSGSAQLDTHFPLVDAPGMYRLAIVVKGSASGDTGTPYTALKVPE